MFRSTKRYGHEVGLSCAFRQWKAFDSHCHFLHGYSLAVKFTFEADVLDERNWVVDFGGLKALKKRLENTFDHKTVVASDDPELDAFERLHAAGVIDLMILKDVGCEKFAEVAYHLAKITLEEQGYSPRCRVIEVEVAEHGANSAIYRP